MFSQSPLRTKLPDPAFVNVIHEIHSQEWIKACLTGEENFQLQNCTFEVIV